MAAYTRLGLLALPTGAGPFTAKALLGLPAYGLNIGHFDTWRPGYGGALVLVVVAGTTEHATLYSDPGLTTEIPNPQTLLSLTAEDGTVYGMWAQPVYVAQAVYLSINDSENTGVIRPPLYFLDGQDASRMLVTAASGTRARTVEEALDYSVWAADYGLIGETIGAEGCTATLNAAIGQVAARGGGEVLLPPGRIPFTYLTLPTSVRLRGAAMGGTTLTSTFSGVAITLDGDGAGLRFLTVDGINVVSGSVGVQGVGVVAAVFEEVTVKRFAIGVRFRGLTDSRFGPLWVSNCTTGADLRGDTDPSGDGEGGVVRNVTWAGGGANLCTTCGLALTFFDSETENIVLDGLVIADNLGDGLLISGARNVQITGASYIAAADGVRALKIQDDSNLSLRAINTVDHVSALGGIFAGGTLLFNGTCASVSFERSDFRGVSFDLTVPTETIVLDNCVEDADVTITGDTTKLMRSFLADDRQVSGNTSDAVPTVAWSKTLEPGEVGLFQAEVVAQQQDGIKYGFWWVAAGVVRPGASLAFNLQTVNFTAGSVVTGATSGATARISAVVQSAGSGTLTLGDIDGTFLDGEVITDADGGDAHVDGTISTSNAALDAGGSTDVRTPRTTGTYDAEWTVSGAKIRLVVTGDTGEAVQWVARVRELVS